MQRSGVENQMMGVDEKGLVDQTYRFRVHRHPCCKREILLTALHRSHIPKIYEIIVNWPFAACSILYRLIYARFRV